MPELSVKDQVKKLAELQKIDTQIYNLKMELTEKPLIIETLQKEFENSKIKLNKLEEKLKAVQLSRKEQELELKSKEDEIAKANTQLFQVKTNREYTAKMSEIENMRADKSRMEEKILLSFDESDALTAEIAKEKAKVAEEEKIFLAQKKQNHEDIKLMEDRIKVLESQRRQQLPGLDPDYLNRYERILAHKQGLAIVPIQANACSGCFMNLTPQTVNEIKMHAEMVECQMCTRILYFEDDL